MGYEQFPEFHFTPKEAEAQTGWGAHPRLHSWTVIEPEPKLDLSIPSSVFFTPEWRSGILETMNHKSEKIMLEIRLVDKMLRST